VVIEREGELYWEYADYLMKVEKQFPIGSEWIYSPPLHLLSSGPARVRVIEPTEEHRPMEILILEGKYKDEIRWASPSYFARHLKPVKEPHQPVLYPEFCLGSRWKPYNDDDDIYVVTTYEEFSRFWEEKELGQVDGDIYFRVEVGKIAGHHFYHSYEKAKKKFVPASGTTEGSTLIEILQDNDDGTPVEITQEREPEDKDPDMMNENAIETLARTLLEDNEAGELAIAADTRMGQALLVARKKLEEERQEAFEEVALDLLRKHNSYVESKKAQLRIVKRQLRGMGRLMDSADLALAFAEATDNPFPLLQLVSPSHVPYELRNTPLAKIPDGWKPPSE